MQEYYNGLLTLWNDKDLMFLENVSTAARREVIELQEQSRIIRFLMNLRPEFESVRATLINRESSLDLLVL